MDGDTARFFGDKAHWNQPIGKQIVLERHIGLVVSYGGLDKYEKVL